ncbi:MAG: sodium:solute symporter [Deltaproteobacteria bacterium]|nr:MAG: sodium:solute symporter [Deltaproteobacteria bacterium]
MLWALVLFAGLFVAIGLASSRNVETAEDYVLAGRKLGLSLALPTLLATWFGAGTLLVAADEVAAGGLSAAALDPIGAGVCLLLAGSLLAKPLWEMKLTTLPDFFGRTYGPTAERAAAVLMVPGYLGWIAAQYWALAALVQAVTGLDETVSLLSVAALGVGYTLAGGMWAVALTDAVQMAVLAVGVVAVSAVIGSHVGDGPVDGLARMWRDASPEARTFLPAGESGAVAGAFLAGALGNLPGQDLTQRMFAARSARVAQLACWLAGGLYLTLGMLPVLLALGAPLVLDEIPEEGVLPAMVAAATSPGMGVLFALTITAAVLSTIDSAILAPSTVLARNLLAPRFGESLALHRAMVAVVGGTALVVAFLGEDAYSLLEASYEVSMVSLLVPLVLGIHRPGSPRAALASMSLGTAVWLGHLLTEVEGLFGTALPMGIGSLGIALIAYLAGGRATSE